MNSTRQPFRAGLPLLPLAICAILGACAIPGQTDTDGPGPTDIDAPATSTPRETFAPPSDASESPAVTDGLVPDDVLAGLIQDAADRGGIDASEVTVLSADAVTWSDGSLGCPQEGQGYIQALVPGYRVILQIGGEEIYYHASERLDFRLCDDPQDPADTGSVER